MLDNSGVTTTNFWDKAAVILSGLCLVHCLALPVLVAVLPFVSELTGDHLHAELLLVVIPISVFAFVIGYRRHRRLKIVGLGVLGMAVLALGGTYVHSRYGIAADRAMTVAGSAILAIAHFLNSRRTRHAG
jgi:MFS superfamily sulfate permease-like transporter